MNDVAVVEEKPNEELKKKYEKWNSLPRRMSKTVIMDRARADIASPINQTQLVSVGLRYGYSLNELGYPKHATDIKLTVISPEDMHKNGNDLVYGDMEILLVGGKEFNQLEREYFSWSQQHILDSRGSSAEAYRKYELKMKEKENVYILRPCSQIILHTDEILVGDRWLTPPAHMIGQFVETIFLGFVRIKHKE